MLWLSDASLDSPDELADRRSRGRQKMVPRVGVLTDGQKTSFCLVKNISRGGALVRLYAAHSRGLEMRLQVGDEHPLTGQIVWVSDQFAGVAFSDILSSEALGRLTQKRAAEGRRSSPRIHTVAQARLSTAGRRYPAELRDISTSGARLRVRSPAKLAPSAMLTLPDLPTVQAFVRWTNGNDIGLLFEGPVPIDVIGSWIAERLIVSPSCRG